MSTLNNISVWWHVAGASIVVGVLVILPENHMSVYDMFTMRVNNSAGLAGGETSGTGFWFYILPLGFLLTQYTITGFDACAHLSEETKVLAKLLLEEFGRQFSTPQSVAGYFFLLSCMQYKMQMQ